MFSLREIFFSPLKCQPNINTLRLHRNPITGIQQVILLGLDGNGFIVEYVPAVNGWKTYQISIPDFQTDCRILTMEILPTSRYNAPASIVYSYTKTTNLSSSDDCSSFSFDRAPIIENSIKSTSQIRSLNCTAKFTKFLIVKNPSTSEAESIVVIGGSDKLIFYSEKNERTLQDITKSIDQYLPELKQTAGTVSAMDMLVITDPKTDAIVERLIVCGHSSGFVNFYRTKFDENGNFNTISTSLEFDSFISSVKLFYHNHRPQEGEEPLLLVCSALEPAVVYQKIRSESLNCPVVLTGTESQDCLNCCSVGDLDLDGKNEIVLGTFGKVCFICRVPIESSKTNSNNGLKFTGETFPVCRVFPLASSAFSCIVTDLTNDGLDELIVATTRGLHIFQLDLNEVNKLIQNRLKNTENLSN